jgi:hypothetical protein
MMRHRELSADDIRLLAADAATVDHSREGLAWVQSTIEKVVGSHFYNGRRITHPQCKALAAQLDDLVQRRMAPLDIRDRERRPTLAKPKGGAVESSYVGIFRMKDSPSFDRLYSLYTLRTTITSRAIEVEYNTLPVAFTYHVAERLMLRTRDVSEALHDIGNELADWAVFLSKTDGRPQFSHNFMAVPFMDRRGALLGEYVNIRHVENFLVRYDEDGEFISESQPWLKTRRHFLVRTFVDRYKLRPNQSHAMRLLETWRREYDDVYMAARDQYVWKTSLECPIPVAAEFGEECSTMLDRVLEDDALVRSMHPDRNVNAPTARDFRMQLGEWHPAYGRAPLRPTALVEAETAPIAVAA